MPLIRDKEKLSVKPAFVYIYISNIFRGHGLYRLLDQTQYEHQSRSYPLHLGLDFALWPNIYCKNFNSFTLNGICSDYAKIDVKQIHTMNR